MKTNYVLIGFTLLRSVLLQAQVPNNSFENWNSTDPDNWQTSNTINGNSIVSVTKVNSAKAGSNAMKLATWSYQGFVFGPVAICPKSNSFFPYSGQPGMITGWYTSNLQGGDKMMISGVLRKNGGTIAGGSTYI